MLKHETIYEYIADCTEAVASLMEKLRAFIDKTLAGAIGVSSTAASFFFSMNEQKLSGLLIRALSYSWNEDLLREANTST